MATSSVHDSERDPIRELVARIDRDVEAGRSALDVASVLTEYADPGVRGAVSPLVYGNEGWYWPWNRAGFAYLERGRPDGGAQIFTCAYLTALWIQNNYQERFHKGSSLCNIAYSLLRAKKPVQARVPAALGIIEDITTFIDPATTGNLNNLRAAACPEARIQLIVEHSTEIYRRRGRYPLYPEVVLHSLREFNPDLRHFIDQMRGVASRFTPQSVPSSLNELAGIWDQYATLVSTDPYREELAHGRAEPTFRVGASPISGTLSTPGTTPAQ